MPSWRGNVARDAGVPGSNRPRLPGVAFEATPRAFLEETMQRELTPTEARSGWITGRVFLVLLVSSLGAVGALALAWYLLSPQV
ncbi:hypothetical protein B7486_76070 [cyanobacterium TDX16]|nr:hypothetical protein B7486_76070 [cyanobacterium TDX16]